LVDTKKRVRKAKEKQSEDKLSSQNSESSLMKRKTGLVKDAQVQTPNIKRFTSEDFITPVKIFRNILHEDKRRFERIKQNLFSDSSSKKRDSKSESRQNGSSENSIKMKNGSGVGTSELKCSEYLTPIKENIQDENVDITVRYLGSLTL
jgi:hypothetical protein